VLVDNPPPRADGFAAHPVRVVVLEWATFIAATVAAVGSVVRVAQNERSYRLMKKMYKKRRKK
jgi:hypothetical protein